MDVWVNKTQENYLRLTRAFRKFGLALFAMSDDNFLNNPDLDVFTFGRQPVAIDIMTSIKGLTFSEAYAHATNVDVEGLSIRLIHYNDLLEAKKAAGRPRD